MLACYFAVFVSMQKTSKRLQQSAIACLELISTSDLEIEFHEIESFKSNIFDFRSHVRTCGYKTFQEIESLNNALKTFDLMKNVKKLIS